MDNYYKYGRMGREPNLQNIPVRTELGKQIREAFFPKVELKIDYESLERTYVKH